MGLLLHQLQVTVGLEKERIKVQLIPLQCLCQVQMLMISRGNPLFADSCRAPLSSEIPEWLQEFRENLVDEIPVHGGFHASSSHEPSLEPTPTRSVDLGKHSVYTHFPEDRNCEICQRTKITRAPCRKRNGGAAPCAENLVIRSQQITKFSVKVVNLETIIDMQSWCRTWPPNGSSRIRAKQKLLRKHKKPCKKFWSPTGSLKSFTQTILWNLAKHVKIFPGVIVRDTTQIRNKWDC